MITTFEDITRKYNQAMECMHLNEEAALNENTNPPRATWLHHPTLVKWLYGSSKEFLNDYMLLSKKLKNPHNEEIVMMNILQEDLTHKLNLFNSKLRHHFFQDAKLIGELK